VSGHNLIPGNNICLYGLAVGSSVIITMTRITITVIVMSSQTHADLASVFMAFGAEMIRKVFAEHFPDGAYVHAGNIWHIARRNI